MAAITYPGAILKLIPPGTNDPRIVPVGACLHIAVSTADSLYSYFSGPSGGIESHFYIRSDGTVEQYRDLAYEADAQGAGNSWLASSIRYGIISIETEGLGAGTWTPEQIAAIKALLRWLSEKFGFPLRKIPSAQPQNAAEGGVGYHSMFNAWNPNGHSCPGADRIKQFTDTLVPWMGTRPEADDMQLTDPIDPRNPGWTVGSVMLATYAASRAAGAALKALQADLDAVQAKVAALSAAPAPVAVDADALASKVADLLAERLKA